MSRTLSAPLLTAALQIPSVSSLILISSYWSAPASQKSVFIMSWQRRLPESETFFEMLKAKGFRVEHLGRLIFDIRRGPEGAGADRAAGGNEAAAAVEAATEGERGADSGEGAAGCGGSEPAEQQAAESGGESSTPQPRIPTSDVAAVAAPVALGAAAGADSLTSEGGDGRERT